VPQAASATTRPPTATTEIYTLSLHDALPISHEAHVRALLRRLRLRGGGDGGAGIGWPDEFKDAH